MTESENMDYVRKAKLRKDIEKLKLSKSESNLISKIDEERSMIPIYLAEGRPDLATLAEKELLRLHSDLNEIRLTLSKL